MVALSAEEHPVIVAFLGPSLAHHDAQAIAPNAILLPPVCQGDLLSAVDRYRPDVVVMIDGEFGQTLSVWHKEILFALHDGVRVFGASSMGALRAAELDRFGMEGVGEVYRHYANQFLTSDADVALLHADGENGWRPFTWPMVNVWATISSLRDRGIVDDAGCSALLAGAEALHFTDRSRRALVQQLREQGRSDAEQLVDAFVDHFVDQKKIDAIEAMTMAANATTVPRPNFEEPLHLLGRIGGAMVATDTTLQSASHPLRGYQLVNDVALHDPDFEQLSQRALDRAAVLEYAGEAGVQLTEAEIASEASRFFSSIGVEDDKIAEWARANDLTTRDFDRFLRDLALRRHMQRWALDVRLYGGNREIIRDQLRIENRYVDAVKAATRRRQLADSTTPMEWPREDESLRDLLIRHVIATNWKVHVDFETTAADHGFESTSGLLTALLDASAARQEADARRQRIARIFGNDEKAEIDTSDFAKRSAALAAHSLLESHQTTSIVLAFSDLGIADAIASGHTSTEQIAAACDADPERMARLLRSVHGLGLVACEDDTWSLSLSGDVFRSDHPASLAVYARDLRSVTLPVALKLADVIRGQDPRVDQPSADADLAFSAVTWALGQDEFIAGLFDPTYAGHIVDVGGGLGRTATLLSVRCPSARVSLVEQASVVDRACAAVEGTSVNAYSADDFVERADRIIITRVFCTLSDNDAFELLSKVRGWINEGGEIHLIDSILDDGVASTYVDLLNLVRTGGSSRTIEQWRDLVASCGLSISEIEPFKGRFSHIVLVVNESATPALEETFI